MLQRTEERDTNVDMLHIIHALLKYLFIWLHVNGVFTWSSSLAEPLRSTSISRQRLRKSLNTVDSLSGFCNSGVPLVAIRYRACSDTCGQIDGLSEFKAVKIGNVEKKV